LYNYDFCHRINEIDDILKKLKTMEDPIKDSNNYFDSLMDRKPAIVKRRTLSTTYSIQNETY